ncbi:MAG: hypothetical protein DRQ45_05180 [Gammaproteobacteria bacterium]|nr:MAG: hypothetical protein DRQ45_05180 [Gammaproteobacteria bacterium]
MRMSGLTLGSLPPISIPLQFFLTAPWFGILAALLLLFNGPGLWTSHWNPALIGLTHLITLGFVTMTMLGALYQLLPVLSGEQIPGGRLLAQAVHLLLVAGVLCLSAGFVFGEHFLLGVAVVLLAVALVGFTVAIGSKLVTNIAGGDSIHAMRLAVVALVVTIGLGFYRALGYLYPLVSTWNLTMLHVSWALLGWILILVMGVSFQVIPMFQVTPDYPPWVSRFIPPLVFTCLLLLAFVQAPLVVNGLVIVLGAAVLVYAGFSLRLTGQRKRKLMDVSVRFWQLGLSCLVLAVLLFWLIFLLPDIAAVAQLSSRGMMLVAVLMIAGFACSIIMGMLQKIVSFLAFLHLQRHCGANIRAIRSLPNMHGFISPARSLWLLRIHAVALAALLGAVMYDPLTGIAGLALLLDFGWLAFLMINATRLYAGTRRRIAAICS